MAKPLSRDGGVGCVRLDVGEHRRQMQEIFYAPILAQSFIEGVDVSCNLYADDGRVKAFVTQTYARSIYTAYHDPAVFADVSKIVSRLRLTGLYNFDMRLTSDGALYYLECNPRVSYRLAMAMLAGFNMVACGTPWAPPGEPAPERKVTVPFAKAMLRAALAPWTLGGSAGVALRYLLDDPIPYLRETLGLEQFH
jgi:hypothetical protein